MCRRSRRRFSARNNGNVILTRPISDRLSAKLNWQWPLPYRRCHHIEQSSVHNTADTYSTTTLRLSVFVYPNECDGARSRLRYAIQRHRQQFPLIFIELAHASHNNITSCNTTSMPFCGFETATARFPSVAREHREHS